MDGTCQKTDLGSLPLELFHLLIDKMISAVGLHNTTSLRLVNKTFDNEVIQSFFRGRYLKPNSGRFDSRIPRSLYVRFILWRLQSPRGQRSILSAHLKESIDFYESHLSQQKSKEKSSTEVLLRHLAQAVADHVPMKLLRFRPLIRAASVRRIAQGALVLAVSVGDLESVKSILAEGAHANHGTVHLARPLVAACRSGNQDMVELLLDRGAKVSGIAKYKPNDYAITPLRAACEGGHTHIVHFLLRHVNEGSDRDFDIDLEGAIALNACIRVRQNDLFLELYHQTWNANFEAGTTAGYTGNIEVVNMLLDDVETNKTFESKQSQASRFLHLAARNGRTELAKSLMERNIFKAGQRRSLGLYLAVAYRRHEVVDLLLQNGGVVNDENALTEVYEGFEREFRGTMLVVAAGNDDVAMLKILVGHGADFWYENQGIMAIRKAMAMGCRDAFQFLVATYMRLNSGRYPTQRGRIFTMDVFDEFQRNSRGRRVEPVYVANDPLDF